MNKQNLIDGLSCETHKFPIEITISSRSGLAAIYSSLFPRQSRVGSRKLILHIDASSQRREFLFSKIALHHK
jgi:hypothetical protein